MCVLTFFSDSSQEEIVEERVDDLTIDQRIEKLMSTITGENEVGDHIVIVQDGEHIQVIDTGDTAVEGKENFKKRYFKYTTNQFDTYILTI